MSSSDRQDQNPAAEAKIYDVLGVGFGPANLSLAVVMEECSAADGLERLFLEAKPQYVWHPGMLLEDSLLQVSVLKDLITVIDPTSRFTFLCYLKEKGRLHDFLNLRNLFPTRLEFNDYLAWAAAQLDHRVRYGRRVVEVVPDTGENGETGILRVVVENIADGQIESYRTRNLVVATGGVPQAPPGFELKTGGRIFHSHHFLNRIDELIDRQRPQHFAVVGSGQSAAELFYYLLTRYSHTEVTATIRRFAYKPVDESDFTNTIFFPEWVEYFNRLPDDKRREFFGQLKDVNYAVIDHALIRQIYELLYKQRVSGRERGRIRPFLHLERMAETDDGVSLGYRDLMSEEPVDLEVDAAVLCTGYDWPKEHPLLEQLAEFFERDDLGGYRVERDYRIANRPGLSAGVFLQGYCEDTHGISETVLSLLPVRANDILQSIVAGHGGSPH